jgi:hypothetical protein
MPEPISSRGALNEAKRQTILALLAGGNSRRSAARFVGCAPCTIGRTVLRDPEFAEKVARAEQSAEVHLLRLVQTAAKSEKHWRAAAWLLERRNPQDFATRPPRVFTGPQVVQLLAHIMDVMTEDLPEGTYEQAIAKLEKMVAESNEVEFAPAEGAAGEVATPGGQTASDQLDEPVGDLADLVSTGLVADSEEEETAEPAGATQSGPIASDARSYQ